MMQRKETDGCWIRTDWGIDGQQVNGQKEEEEEEKKRQTGGRTDGRTRTPQNKELKKSVRPNGGAAEDMRCV